MNTEAAIIGICGDHGKDKKWNLWPQSVIGWRY